MTDRETHWNEVYGAREETALTWFEDTPAVSMTLLRRAGLTRQSRVVDVGGGASRLVDALLADGVRDVTVLDLSAAALAVARGRLGARADAVNWVVGDVTKWDPSQPMDLWHDRAVFHFLTEEADRAAYVRTMMRALPAGATAVIGTFALDGARTCRSSGMTRLRWRAPWATGSRGSTAMPISTARRWAVPNPLSLACSSGSDPFYRAG